MKRVAAAAFAETHGVDEDGGGTIATQHRDHHHQEHLGDFPFPLCGTVSDDASGRCFRLRLLVDVRLLIGDGRCSVRVSRSHFELAHHQTVCETGDGDGQHDSGVCEYEGIGNVADLEVDERKGQGDEPNAADCQEDSFRSELVPVGVRIADSEVAFDGQRG